MRAFLIALFCFIAPVAATAQAYRAENWLIVAPLNTTDFEVIEANGEGPRGIWCAAADFAQSRLGLPLDARLYVKTPRGPSVSGLGRKGVIFTVDPDRLDSGPSRSYSASVNTAGQGLPSHHARGFCPDFPYDFFDR